MTAKLIAAGVSILAMALTLNAEQSKLKRAGTEALQLGITHYSIQKSEKGVEFTLLNGNGATTGVVRIADSGELRSAEYTSTDGHTLRITWNLTLGMATIATERELQPLVMTFDFATRHWERPLPAVELLNGSETTLLIAVLRDADGMRAQASAAHLAPVPFDTYYDPNLGRLQLYNDAPPTGEAALTSSPKCNGPQVWGSWGADWKSVACNKARADANSQCWNQYCIGCCSLDECNAVCLVGDFVCYAGVAGTSCSAP